MANKKTEKSKVEKRAKEKKSEVDELRGQIAELGKERDELFAKLQRVSADYANYQKRSPKQIADSIMYEKERIIKTLLPVIDNFEHTVQNAHSAEKAEVLAESIGIIYDQMLDILKSHNVERIEALGEVFDPSLHEAMMQRNEPEQQEGVVLEEFQSGYTLGGRVVRPSRVIVNKFVAEEQKDSGDGEGEQENDEE